jgi:hypothetical protein
MRRQATQLVVPRVIDRPLRNTADISALMRWRQNVNATKLAPLPGHHDNSSIDQASALPFRKNAP